MGVAGGRGSVEKPGPLASEPQAPTGLLMVAQNGRLDRSSASKRSREAQTQAGPSNVVSAGHDHGGKAWGRAVSRIGTTTFNGGAPFA